MGVKETTQKFTLCMKNTYFKYVIIDICGCFPPRPHRAPQSPQLLFVPRALVLTLVVVCPYLVGSGLTPLALAWHSHGHQESEERLFASSSGTYPHGTANGPLGHLCVTSQASNLRSCVLVVA